MLFKDMTIDPRIIRALEENQIVSPTEIQEQSIPHGLSLRKSHVIGQAKTGSGKTLAFAIPIVERINPKNRHIQAVVLVPTRELCKQNAAVFRSISKYKKVKVVEIYGGASIRAQIDRIRQGGQIIIATPGRLIDLVRQGEIKFKYVDFVALDEADRMLDMGFLPDMQFLLLDAMRDVSPRLFLFSATMMGEIKRLIVLFTKQDKVHEINVSKDSLTVATCEQYAYNIENNKFGNFIRILNEEQPSFSIIFTKTKRKAAELCRRLKNERGINFDLNAGFIHGDLTQATREKTIKLFRNKQLNCLVGTNVLARGLDFPKVSHVFNYDLPRDPEDYVHRIGRTARVGGMEKNVTSGKAISLVSTSQRDLMYNIERLLTYSIKKRTVPNAIYKKFTPKKPSSNPDSPQKSTTQRTNKPKNRIPSKKYKKKKQSYSANKYRKRVHHHPPKKKKKQSISANNRQKITSSAK